MVPIYSDITDNINGQTVCTSHDQSSEVADMRSDGLLQKQKLFQDQIRFIEYLRVLQKDLLELMKHMSI